MASEFNLDELDDLDLDSEIVYEVWAIGYDINDNPTEFDYLLDSFRDPDPAATFADSISMKEIREVEGNALVRADHFSIEVETTAVIDDEPTNLGTIYRRSIYYNSITADLMLTERDYAVQDDGCLLITSKYLANLKDKETIDIMFLEESGNTSILTVKIVNEVAPDSFMCEIVF